MDPQQPLDQNQTTETPAPTPIPPALEMPPIPEIPKAPNLSDSLKPYRWQITIVGGIIIALLLGVYTYLKYVSLQNYNSIAQQAQDEQKKIDEIKAKRANSEIYKNNQYGFSIILTGSWKGYTVVNSQWEGWNVVTAKVMDHGPMITLRHPQWTADNPREDMPIMVFTLEQWVSVKGEQMSLGAAPIPPSILSQNSKYVIALPARYNFDYKIGWEEVDKLVHTLKGFEPVLSGTTGEFCGGIANILCSDGYSCKYDGNYPDAGGTCVKN